MNGIDRCRQFTALLTTIICVLGAPASADVVTDWNKKACDIVLAAKPLTPVANRTMAIVQTAVYEAVKASAEASPEAAVAAANRAALTQLMPAQKEAIDHAYQEAIASIPNGDTKDTGIAIGEKAAARVIERRAEDGAAAAESYRPLTTPGVYVPTTIPAVPQWSQRKPWLLTSPSQFRPGAPPALDSERWARDFNEVKALGAKEGSTRTAAQTEIARFWEATLPPIYHGVVRSVADQPGRKVVRNARLFAAVTQAVDDAIIAIFDAKYHYNFWRPITAIRNGDRDGNYETEPNASWMPFIDTPMHPEYPCAHCILAATVATILAADIGHGPMITLTTTSNTANGASRSWKTIEDFVQEVAVARIYDGVHYRNSSETGTAMGRQIGALAAKMHFGPP
ncbi:MAG: vanadium-dependent haloperoxidase [Steroidobacteraceae bacterium]